MTSGRGFRVQDGLSRAVALPRLLWGQPGQSCLFSPSFGVFLSEVSPERDCAGEAVVGMRFVQGQTPFKALEGRSH